MKQSTAPRTAHCQAGDHGARVNVQKASRPNKKTESGPETRNGGTAQEACMDLRERLGLGTRSLKSAGSCSMAQFMASRPYEEREREKKASRDERLGKK